MAEYRDFWLTIPEYGTPKCTKGSPRLARDERAMKVRLTLPDGFFDTPTLSASITVPEGGAPPPHIDLTAASEALSMAIGVDVDLRLAPVEEEA